MALCVIPVSADDISLGYCDGNNVEFPITAESVAICIPAEEFPMYAGTKIAGVRIGLMSDAAKGVRVFLRNSPEGADILSFHTGVLYQGWNDISFDSPVDWPEGDVYAGYELPSGLKAGMSHVGPLVCVPGSCWTAEGGIWKDRSAEGCQPLCIQLLVDGGSYEKNDVALISADPVTFEAGGSFEITGLLRNNTSSTLTGIRLSYDWGEGAREADATVDETLPGEIGYFHVPVDGLFKTGETQVELRVVSVAGRPDDYAFNDNTTVSVTGVSDIVTRKLLLEEFTGQRCPQCPAGKELIDDGIRHLDNVVLVCHHIGFGEDSMTAPGSNGLIFFYNSGGSSYAPALMFDRTPSEGEPGPVTNVPEARAIAERIKARQDLGAQVAVGIDQSYDACGELGINVRLRKVKGMKTGENPVLNVLLVENGIVSFQAPDYDDYTHDAVVRMFVSAPLGDPVTLTEDEEKTCSYKIRISDDYRPENMSVVAFVSNFNASDPNDCEVYNTETAPLPQGGGVGCVTDDDIRIEAIFDLTGRRLDSPQPGVNIVRYSDGTSRKVFVKHSTVRQ